MCKCIYIPPEWLTCSNIVTHFKNSNRNCNYFPKIFAPNIKVRINKIKKIKNNTLAIEAAPAAIPVKPKIAAMIAITMKITAHLNIIINFSYQKSFKDRAKKYIVMQ